MRNSATAAESVPAPTGVRILVVDDDMDAAELLRLALEDRGFETLVASDGTTALVTAKAYQPAIAILDIGLPDMTGLELARAIRDLLPDAPPRLIAWTAYSNGASRMQASAAGFHAFFPKPVDLNALLGEVERVAQAL